MPGTENITVPEGGAELTPQQTADLINDLICVRRELLENHPLNQKRMAEGKTRLTVFGRGAPVIVLKWNVCR